jgi:arginyl-tRNA synthetase
MMASFPTDTLLDSGRAHVATEIATALRVLIPSGTLALAQIYGMLERPPEPQMGDYALPCFKLAKELRRKPQDIALELAKALSELASPWIEKVETAGAFVNVHVQPGTLAGEILPSLRNGSYFQRIREQAASRPRVMIEYSQPNTHKVFHVGHMRNVALGDALGRLYEHCGYPVIMANYIGDEGAHIAKCLWYIQSTGQTIPTEQRGVWLGEMYAAATQRLEDASPEDLPKYQAEVSAVLRSIESKQGPIYDLWRQTRQWSLADFESIYRWTGARFDHVFYESEVSDDSQKIVDEFLSQGIFVVSDGAVGLDLKEEKLGFVIVRKSDGNTTYATKDLALARLKFAHFKIEKSIYVVASEQNLHFKQVFRTLEKMGFEQAKDSYHLSYGMVVLPDGKMSSRKGNIITFQLLADRLAAELDKNLDKYRGEWSEDEINTIRHRLAVGAIRYGMVCSDPVKDIVFDIHDWLSFEGNTGPYLMYSYARTQSILRKAQEQGYSPSHEHLSLLQSPEERELLRYLNDMNHVILASCEQNRPSTLCHHLFDTCKVYNRLLAQVSILKAETDALRSARLALLDAFSRGLRQGLLLLGMEPPERM